MIGKYAASGINYAQKSFKILATARFNKCKQLFEYQHLLLLRDISGLYYKPMMIVNDNSRVVNKLEASLTEGDRVVIYDCHMFIVQATGGQSSNPC